MFVNMSIRSAHPLQLTAQLLYVSSCSCLLHGGTQAVIPAQGCWPSLHFAHLTAYPVEISQPLHHANGRAYAHLYFKLSSGQPYRTSGTSRFLTLHTFTQLQQTQTGNRTCRKPGLPLGICVSRNSGCGLLLLVQPHWHRLCAAQHSSNSSCLQAQDCSHLSARWFSQQCLATGHQDSTWMMHWPQWSGRPSHLCFCGALPLHNLCSSCCSRVPIKSCPCKLANAWLRGCKCGTCSTCRRAAACTHGVCRRTNALVALAHRRHPQQDQSSKGVC